MDVIVTILEFKNQLKSQGYAESTIALYQRNLDLFKHYLEEIKISDLRKVTRQTLSDYQTKIMEEPIAMETRALKIRPVKRVFEYLTENHKLLINPAEGLVESCRKNRKIGPVLTFMEMEKLLEQPNLSLNTGIRDRAIMEVLYCTGIRLDELLNIKIHDVDLKEKVLFVRRGKGKKQRVTPLGKAACMYLKEYLNQIRPRYAKKNLNERTLFLNHSGLPITKGAVSSNLRKYRIEAGIKKPVSSHTFRRTCATHMLQQGADIRYVQKLLGHRHLSTTQIYTKVIPNEVKKTHDKTHPGLEVSDHRHGICT